LTSGKAFVALDRLLDQARYGPCFLRQPAVAAQVLASIEYGARRGDYELHAWVIMPNHVHLLLTPRVNVSKALGALKAGSAKSANLLLGRPGRPFGRTKAMTTWSVTTKSSAGYSGTSKTIRLLPVFP
jgi:REP element-mobilizing transposase RayT